ncbi:mannitol dehydrogenase family protein [Cellulomonas sp. McL0617]|uniref:mannitol dehydrogenase family protein n=1 Tax=Cellulomonas sp. McL0617 TaxID=3415675 RepID=UPI003CF8143A
MPDRTRRPPVRVVHLGLGAFHRAHQAWYTDRADDGWGIAAFTGRSPAAATALAAQDCVYVLVERSAQGDTASVVQSIVSAHDGADAPAWRAAVADPVVAVLTLTVTEAGYHATASGELDAALLDDVAALRSDGSARTAPGRVVDGLRARRAAGVGPVAVVSCDNLPANGSLTERVVRGVAGAVDPDLDAWIARNVSFVSTMVDRITPATTDDDRAVARELTGFADAVPVVTEPFSEWVLSGEFPAGRPPWERVGARFVDDIEPYERRKLWLLNAGHSLLAYRGRLLGHETVAQAAGPLADELELLWQEARPLLTLASEEIDEALAALRERFANPRIRHSLAQIATDGSFKLPVRIVDPLRRRVAAGLPAGQAQLGVLADWAEYLVRFGPTDDASGGLADAIRGMLDPRARAGAVLAAIDGPDILIDPLATRLERL